MLELVTRRVSVLVSTVTSLPRVAACQAAWNARVLSVLQSTLQSVATITRLITVNVNCIELHVLITIVN